MEYACFVKVEGIRADWAMLYVLLWDILKKLVELKNFFVLDAKIVSFISLHLSIYLSIYICMYVCMYVCMYEVRAYAVFWAFVKLKLIYVSPYLFFIWTGGWCLYCFPHLKFWFLVIIFEVCGHYLESNHYVNMLSLFMTIEWWFLYPFALL